MNMQSCDRENDHNYIESFSHGKRDGENLGHPEKNWLGFHGKAQQRKKAQGDSRQERRDREGT